EKSPLEETLPPRAMASPPLPATEPKPLALPPLPPLAVALPEFDTLEKSPLEVTLPPTAMALPPLPACENSPLAFPPLPPVALALPEFLTGPALAALLANTMTPSDNRLNKNCRFMVNLLMLRISMA